VDGGGYKRLQHPHYPPQRTLPDNGEQAAEVIKTARPYRAHFCQSSFPLRRIPPFLRRSNYSDAV